MRKWVLIGAVVLIVVVGVGILILDRTVFAPVEVSTGAPVAPTIAVPTATKPADESAGAVAATPTEPGSATPAMILARIDAEQSEVRYEVGETFLRNNEFATAIGRTQGIAGEVLVDTQQPSNSQIGDIVIDVSQFTSDRQRRDNYLRRNALQSAQYPHATFKTQSIDGMPDQITVGDEVSFTMTGDLTVKETTRTVTWDVTMQVEEDRLVGSASTEILMSDFDVGPIRIAPLETEDLVELYFDFVLVRA